MSHEAAKGVESGETFIFDTDGALFSVEQDEGDNGSQWFIGGDFDFNSEEEAP